MKKRSLLSAAISSLFTVLSFSLCYSQPAVVYYKDSTLNVRVSNYDYEGLTTNRGFMKWGDIKKIVFQSRKLLTDSKIKDIQSKTAIVFWEDNPEILAANASNDEDKSIPIVDGMVTVSEVVKMDSVKKDELYLRAKTFFIDYFKSGKDVIQFDDKAEGTIIGKGFSSFSYSVTMLLTTIFEQEQLWFKIKIQVKEGRYKYELSDFRVKNLNYNTEIPIEGVIVAKEKPIGQKKIAGTMYRAEISELKREISVLKGEIIAAMNKASKKDDW